MQNSVDRVHQVVPSLASNRLTLEPYLIFGKIYSVKSMAIVKRLHKPILSFLRFTTTFSARNPRKTIAGTVCLTLLLLLVGLLTNFFVNVDEKELWTPMDSLPLQHHEWIIKKSGFPADPKLFSLFFHSDGKNVLGEQQMLRMFDALDTVRGVEGYHDLCSKSSYRDHTGLPTCEVVGAVRFWNSSSALFKSQVFTDEQTISSLSHRRFADGMPFNEEDIFGFPQRDQNDQLLNVVSYSMYILFPPGEDVQRAQLESEAVDAILALDDSWHDEPSNSLRVEVFADRSFGDEFRRAIVVDLPLGTLVLFLIGEKTSHTLF